MTRRPVLSGPGRQLRTDLDRRATFGMKQAWVESQPSAPLKEITLREVFDDYDTGEDLVGQNLRTD